MSATIHVVYPNADGTTFDHGYYVATHLPLARKHFEPHGLMSLEASKGTSAVPDGPSAYHLIATLRFPDEASMNAALGAAADVVADIANFTNTTPNFMIGEPV